MPDYKDNQEQERRWWWDFPRLDPASWMMMAIVFMLSATYCLSGLGVSDDTRNILIGGCGMIFVVFVVVLASLRKRV